MKGQSSNLSYHLSEAMLNLIYRANGTLYERTNLIAIICSDVEAMLDWADSDELCEKINVCNDRLEKLRDSYEPILDSYDGVTPKRIAYEKKLDLLRTSLIKLINDNDLVSASMLKEIQATKWGSGIGR